MSKILIIGGAGFIGSHTADALAKKGHKIRIFDNLEPPVHTGKWPPYLSRDYELVKGDVRNKEELSKALEGIDYVYHLAAYQDQMPDFSKFFHVNTVSTALIYEIIVEKKLPIKKFVLASSQFVYGDGIYKCKHNGKLFYPELRSVEQFKNRKWEILCEHQEPAEFIPFKEDQQVSPTNSYGLSKLALENLSLRFGKTYNIPTTLFRYSIVQGQRQSPLNFYSGALRIFVTQALAQEPISVYEDGNQLRDFVNIEDVARANALAIEKKETDFQIFNVGSGIAYKVIDFANTVKKLTKSNSKILIEGFRRTDTRNAISDISKLKSMGWNPIYNTEKSIKDYINWIKESGFDLSMIKAAKEKLKNLGVVDK